MPHHDNPRFNISGRGVEELTKVLELYEFLDGRGRHWRNPDKKYIPWHGYTLHPNLGMLLHRYEDRENKGLYTPFPFGEGEKAETLATFFHNYSVSDKARIEPFPEAKSYDPFECFRADAERDIDLAHDGDNDLGWRVYTGTWGQVLDYHTPLAIKPIYLWFGK